MKKIHTPISSRIGNHETRIESSGCMLSSTGAALNLTLRSVRRETRFGSFGAKVEKPRPSA